MSTTDKPLNEAIIELLEERDMSTRALSRESRKGHEGIGHSTLARVIQGRPDIGRRGIEAIAHGFDIHPSYFAEYRLMMAREQLDPRKVGLKQALRNLDGR